MSSTIGATSRPVRYRATSNRMSENSLQTARPVMGYYYFYGNYCDHSHGVFGKLWPHPEGKGLDKGISPGLFQH